MIWAQAAMPLTFLSDISRLHDGNAAALLADYPLEEMPRHS
jgi:hypothetical protein